MSAKQSAIVTIICTRCKNIMKCMPQHIAKAKKQCVYCGKNLKIKDVVLPLQPPSQPEPQNSPSDSFYQAPKKAEFDTYRPYNGILQAQDL